MTHIALPILFIQTNKRYTELILEILTLIHWKIIRKSNQAWVLIFKTGVFKFAMFTWFHLNHSNTMKGKKRPSGTNFKEETQCLQVTCPRLWIWNSKAIMKTWIPWPVHIPGITWSMPWVKGTRWESRPVLYCFLCRTLVWGTASQRRPRQEVAKNLHALYEARSQEREEPW